MAGPINRLPWGLLGFLGLKNFGQYPNQLVESLQPTWDLLELYAGAHGEHVFTGLTQFTATGFVTGGAAVLVPQTELWYVSQSSSAYATGVGETLSAKHGYIDGTLMEGMLTQGSTVLAASQISHAAGSFPVFVGPGTQLGWWIDAFTGSPEGTFHAKILRMPI